MNWKHLRLHLENQAGIRTEITGAEQNTTSKLKKLLFLSLDLAA